MQAYVYIAVAWLLVTTYIWYVETDLTIQIICDTSLRYRSIYDDTDLRCRPTTQIWDKILRYRSTIRVFSSPLHIYNTRCWLQNYHKHQVSDTDRQCLVLYIRCVNTNLSKQLLPTLAFLYCCCIRKPLHSCPRTRPVLVTAVCKNINGKRYRKQRLTRFPRAVWGQEYKGSRLYNILMQMSVVVACLGSYLHIVHVNIADLIWDLVFIIVVLKSTQYLVYIV